MKKSILFIFFWLHAYYGTCQVLQSENGYVRFFSSALIEDITAENHQAKALFNPETNEAVFLIPIADFEFNKKLMKEHFNENYMESDKYPEAYFKGTISGYQDGATRSDAIAEGEMMIHGVKNKVRIPGEIVRQNNALLLKAVFQVALEDYDIEIPKLMFQKIAEEVEVTIQFEFQNPSL
ncbi:YceI family protein [Algoriphagus lutimaris]|uniref:YceI family protein n=1 Tax=Algoriphagus lutimaris TaxID=613197 RepID=UPI00196B592D|nr:YceI family protein [Algoriphagus lutimaris]MBN3518729.1 YceI family protein [Algoriphagus lutimaris]